VTKKECGSSTVLGCRYHGWSYDTKGNLIKAPEFENVPGFDKGKNGLWEVKTAVQEGMVFINFDATCSVEQLGLGEFGAVLRTWGFATTKCIAEWRIDTAVNWKALGLSSCREAEHMLMVDRVSRVQRGS
jgi:phenylpropionate dioxygenase-like ring-hydroxylating dioxygenase large terminal subunit